MNILPGKDPRDPFPGPSGYGNQVPLAGRLLTAFIDCGTCETTYEGAWHDDSLDESDRAEAPVEEQTCPNGHTEMLEYPLWSFRSEAG